MLLIPYQLFNHPPTTPTTLLTCCKFWLVINSIAVHVTLFTSGLFFFVTALPMHKAHVRTSSTIQEALHKVARWPAVNVDFTQKAVKYTPLPAEKEVLDHTWMWTSRKKRLNTLSQRKKSWTTRDEAHTERTWRYGSRVVGSDVTWRDSKHVTHCPYVTPWHYSLPDKCLGSNVTWYFIQRTSFNLK